MRFLSARWLAPLVILPIATIALWPEAPWSWMQAVGIGLAVLGFALWFVARVQLGDAFSILPEARSLVTTGLYRRIRNPIYMFGSVMIAGLVLLANRPVLLFWFVAVAPMQALRARAE